MARKPGTVYPSERRYYFKEPYERLLDDPAYENMSDNAFVFRIRFRCFLKRGVKEDGEMEVTRSGLHKLSGKSHWKAQLKPLKELAEFGLFSFTVDGEVVLIRDLNYAEDQRFNPKKPQEKPAENPTIEMETETEIEIQRDTETETYTETDTRKALIKVKGTGHPKPTRPARCACPESLNDFDLDSAREFIEFDKPELKLSNDDFHRAWAQFRKNAKGQMEGPKWITEFGIWLCRNWPPESEGAADAGNIQNHGVSPLPARLSGSF